MLVVNITLRLNKNDGVEQTLNNKAACSVQHAFISPRSSRIDTMITALIL